MVTSTILRRLDASEMDVETMCKHQHVALFQIRLDGLFVQFSLFLIIDQNHDDISLSLQPLLQYKP